MIVCECVFVGMSMSMFAGWTAYVYVRVCFVWCGCVCMLMSERVNAHVYSVRGCLGDYQNVLVEKKTKQLQSYT